MYAAKDDGRAPRAARRSDPSRIAPPSCTDPPFPDADVEPEEAAAALATWVESIDRSAPCRFFDLMGDGTLDW